MAIGDVWQITIRGAYHAQEIVNVFWYIAATATAVDLLATTTEFRATVLPAIAEVQGGQMSWENILLKQITGGRGFRSEVISPAVAGVQTGEDMPPAICWTFRYERIQWDHRHGYKRFAGVTEGNQASGEAVPAILPSLEDLADILEAQLVPSAGTALTPVVYHQWENGQKLDPPEAHSIGGVSYSHIGTQNSRKYGRGS